jgi:hypothetical protein
LFSLGNFLLLLPSCQQWKITLLACWFDVFDLELIVWIISFLLLKTSLRTFVLNVNEPRKTHWIGFSHVKTCWLRSTRSSLKIKVILKMT